MEKINNILSDSIVYNKLKQIFLFICSAFEETFLYKMFFTKMNEKTYEESLFGKFSELTGRFFMWVYDLISDVWLVKLAKKIFSVNLKPLISSSIILRIFCINDYKYSLLFLVCLGTLFAVGFAPTMLVAGLCLILFILMFVDNEFKERIKQMKVTAADLFIFLYMIAIFHARNVSDDVQKNQIFLIYTVFVGAYFIFRYYLSDGDKIKLALSAVSASGLVVCAVGFLQFATGSYKTTQWTDTNLFSDIEGRLVATFENPNVLGEYLLFIIPISIAMFLITDKFIWKLIYGAVTLGSCFCMILTYSRGCWIGLILGVVVFILMLYPKLFIPIGVVAPFSLFFIPESIITRITSIGNLQDGSSAFRVYLWRGTLNMIKNIWPFGIGLGNEAFADSYRPYAYEAVVAPHSHNTFLHVMCESGIFGFIVFVLLLYFIFRQLFVTYKETKCRNIKIMSAALVCGQLSMIVQAMFDNTLYNYRMYMLFFAVLAISSALYAVRKEKL